MEQGGRHFRSQGRQFVTSARLVCRILRRSSRQSQYSGVLSFLSKSPVPQRQVSQQRGNFSRFSSKAHHLHPCSRKGCSLSVSKRRLEYSLRVPHEDTGRIHNLH